MQKTHGRRRMSRREKHDMAAGYLFLTPFLIGLFLFTVYPFVYSLYLSFTDYDILTRPSWVGLKNYIEMFTNDP